MWNIPFIRLNICLLLSMLILVSYEVMLLFLYFSHLSPLISSEPHIEGLRKCNRCGVYAFKICIMVVL
jgi:hypothetical protein